MKFLIDNALSPVLSKALLAVGYDSKHVRDYQMQAAADIDILSRAKEEGRIVVSADTDFGTLLSQSGQTTPSAILIRRLGDRQPIKQAENANSTFAPRMAVSIPIRRSLSYRRRCLK